MSGIWLHRLYPGDNWQGIQLLAQHLEERRQLCQVPSTVCPLSATCKFSVNIVD